MQVSDSTLSIPVSSQKFWLNKSTSKANTMQQSPSKQTTTIVGEQKSITIKGVELTTDISFQ